MGQFPASAASKRWLVAMDGRRAETTDGGPTFTTQSGQPMTFARGPVWVLLTAAKPR